MRLGGVDAGEELVVDGDAHVHSWPRSEVTLALESGGKAGKLTLGPDSRHVTFADAAIAQLTEHALSQQH